MIAGFVAGGMGAANGRIDTLLIAEYLDVLEDRELGNLMRRANASNLSDEVKQEIIVHRGAKTLLAQAAFGGVALEQVERN
jgi:hypothetical protein